MVGCRNLFEPIKKPKKRLALKSSLNKDLKESLKSATKVRPDEEQSDELKTPSQAAKTARTRTSVRYASPPVTTAIIIIPHSNPFHDSLRSSQPNNGHVYCISSGPSVLSSYTGADRDFISSYLISAALTTTNAMLQSAIVGLLNELGMSTTVEDFENYIAKEEGEWGKGEEEKDKEEVRTDRIEGLLERSDGNISPTHITNNLLLVASSCSSLRFAPRHPLSHPLT